MPPLLPHHLKECNSPASLGRVLIQKGTQLVLAMSYSVSVTAAQLMLKLYEQYYQQQPVDKALARSWQELYNNKQRNAAYSKSIELEDWLLPVAYQNGRPNFWGYLNELVEGNITNLQAAIEQSTMANVSGKRSKIVSATIGLQILEGFLSGFNLPVASIATQFTGAKTVSFSFQQVVRSFISPGQLGKLLQGHALDTSNGSNALFLNGEAQLLVIDSIITSKDFSINIDKEHSSDFSLNVPAIQKIAGEAKADIKVASSTGLNITFQGEVPLSFAFTCVEAKLDAAGRISLKPSSSVVLFSGSAKRNDHQLLYNEPCMIEL